LDTVYVSTGKLWKARNLRILLTLKLDLNFFRFACMPSPFLYSWCSAVEPIGIIGMNYWCLSSLSLF